MHIMHFFVVIQKDPEPWKLWKVQLCQCPWTLRHMHRRRLRNAVGKVSRQKRWLSSRFRSRYWRHKVLAKIIWETLVLSTKTSVRFIRLNFTSHKTMYLNSIKKLLVTDNFYTCMNLFWVQWHTPPLKLSVRPRSDNTETNKQTKLSRPST